MGVQIATSPVGGLKSAAISNSSLLVPLGTNEWKGVRATLRVNFSNPGSARSTSRLFVGFCTGSAPFHVSDATGNAIGAIQTAWGTYTAGLRQVMTLGQGKREGTTNTTANPVSGYAFYANTQMMTVSIVRVAKGGGTAGGYKLQCGFPNSSATNISFSDFWQLRECVHGSAITVTGVSQGTDTTVASFDETANGLLTHFQIYWDEPDSIMYVEDVAVQFIQ
jgi:hypothetical protein